MTFCLSVMLILRDHFYEIYPQELEIKEKTENARSDSCKESKDILLSLDVNVHLNTSLYDKRYNSKFQITAFSFLSCNIPSPSPNYLFVCTTPQYASGSNTRIRRLGLCVLYLLDHFTQLCQIPFLLVLKHKSIRDNM